MLEFEERSMLFFFSLLVLRKRRGPCDKKAASDRSCQLDLAKCSRLFLLFLTACDFTLVVCVLYLPPRLGHQRKPNTKTSLQKGESEVSAASAESPVQNQDGRDSLNLARRSVRAYDVGLVISFVELFKWCCSKSTNMLPKYASIPFQPDVNLDKTEPQGL